MRFPRSTPRPAREGIRLGGGEIAQTWWGRRWTETLEKFGWHTRLTRGKSYARSGQVVSLMVEPGQDRARVQGSRSKPYDVHISLPKTSRKDWIKAADVLARQALFAAKLLAGEMPEGLDDVFRKAGRPLFPRSRRDLTTDCSCPDWENPCKHIAAAYYILAQELDRDPFLLLKLRGIDREEFIARLRAARRSGPAAPPDPDGWIAPREIPSPAPEANGGGTPTPEGPDLSQNLEGYHRLAKDLPLGWGPSAQAIAQAPPPGARIKEMGAPPFWRGETPFESTLQQALQTLRDRIRSHCGETPVPRQPHRPSGRKGPSSKQTDWY
jgi:uncharacterized Zn finger protein